MQIHIPTYKRPYSCRYCKFLVDKQQSNGKRTFGCLLTNVSGSNLISREQQNNQEEKMREVCPLPEKD